MDVTVVVGAAIIRDGRLLAARRTAPARLAGRWELPGGKVEPGEGEAAALVREIDEELGVRVRVGSMVGPQTWLSPSAVLRVFNATLLAGEPRPLADHSAVRWLTRDELTHLDWVDADLPAVRRIAASLPAGASAPSPPLAGTGQPPKGCDGVSDGSTPDRSLGMGFGRAGPTPPDPPRGARRRSEHERDGNGEDAG